MNRSKKVLYNSISNAVLQIVKLIVGFIIPKIMISIYGSEINGLVTSVTQFISYFHLVEAGLASAAVYSLYKPLAENDTCQINGILSAAHRFYNQIGYIFTLLVLGLAIIYPSFTQNSSITIFEKVLLIIIIGFAGALEFFTMSKYRVLLTADQKIYILSLANICSTVLNTIIIVVLSKFRVNIVIVRAIALSAVFLRSLILQIYVKYKFEFVNFYEKPNNDALRKRWDALYLQILGSIHTGAPVIIATIFTNLKMVSVYSVYNIVLGGISSILSIVVNGLFTSFGDVIARKEQGVLQRAYQEFELTYYMIITWAYSCTMILIMPFIKLYTNGITDIDYYSPILGLLFVINGLVHNIKTPQGMLVISAGLFKETKIQTSIQGIIAVVAGVILVQYFGLSGILMGSILSNLYRDIDLLYFIPRNVTKLNVKHTFYRIIRIFICFIIIQIPFQYIRIEVVSYVEWLKYAVWVGVYAFVIVLAMNTIFDRKLLANVVRRITFMFK